MNNRGVTWFELIVYVLLAGILALIILPALPVREPPLPGSCANNLKQMGIVFQMYSNESSGNFFPPMLTRDTSGSETAAGERREWTMLPAPSWPAIFPEYLTDPGVLFCPEDPHSRKTQCLGPDAYEWYPEGTNVHNVSPYSPDTTRMDGGSYAYTCWLADDALVLVSSILAAELRLGMDGSGPAITQEEARGVVISDLELSGLDSERMRAWIEQRTLERSNGRKFPEPIKIWDTFQLRGNNGGNVIQRLQEGIEQKVVKGNDPVSLQNAMASIPLMWDLTYYTYANPNPDADVQTNHVPPGFNCLYLDGHVEYVPLTSRDHLLCSERVLALGAPEGLIGVGRAG